MQNKKLVIFFFLLSFTLFLRDVPYLNIYLSDKLWLVYIYLIILYFIFSIRTIMKLVKIKIIMLALFLAFIFTILNLSIFSEIIGSAIYFLLWIILIIKIHSLFKSEY